MSKLTKNLTRPSLILFNKAVSLMNKNKLKEAIQIFRGLDKEYPRHFLINFNLGNCYYVSENFLEASKVFHQLHLLDESNIDILKFCGMTYMHLGEYEIASKFFKRMVNIDPKNFEIWINLTFCSARLKKYDDAIYFATQAVSLNPKNPQAFNNLGSALQALHRYQDALICYETSLVLDSNNIISVANIATTLEKLGEYSKSVEVYKSALKMVKPGSQEETDFQFRMSFSLLATGDLQKGWRYYENGFSVGELGRNPIRLFSKPQWDGRSIKGCKLMIWREQGIGDEVLFQSLIPEIFTLCDDIIIECSGRLVTLLTQSFPNCTVREQRYIPNTITPEFEDFDYQIPVGSLCKFYKNDAFSIRKSNGFLVAEPELVEKFKNRLLPFSDKLLVGISWRSENLNTERNIHYVPISEWENILKLNCIQFVNLQYGQCQEEIKNVRDHFGIEILNWPDVDLKNDLDSLAAIICNLDLVISPSSFASAFSPALGVRTKIIAHKNWTLLGQKGWPWFENVDLYIPESRNKPISSIFPELKTDLLSLIEKRLTITS